MNMAMMQERDITIIDPLVINLKLQDIIESYPSSEKLNDLYNPSDKYKLWFEELLERMES